MRILTRKRNLHLLGAAGGEPVEEVAGHVVRQVLAHGLPLGVAGLDLQASDEVHAKGGFDRRAHDALVTN